MVELTWMLIAASLAALGLMALLGCRTTFDWNHGMNELSDIFLS